MCRSNACTNGMHSWMAIRCKDQSEFEAAEDVNYFDSEYYELEEIISFNMRDEIMISTLLRSRISIARVPRLVLGFLDSGSLAVINPDNVWVSSVGEYGVNESRT